ncbi:hypothetical protein ACP70R_007440 [Stipagrostis hirtigluma subsp. patula]
MEIVTGALPCVLIKLGELLIGEYNLQKEVKGGIMFLQAELESMKAALEDISKTPANEIPKLDRIWAQNVRELSYNIEDNIDTFMVQVNGSEPAKKHGIKKFIDKTLGSLMQPKIRRKIATNIRDIKSHVIEVHERRRRYEVNHSVAKPVTVDPRLLGQYRKAEELVGIDGARDELIKILMEGNEVSMKQDKIVSIVGFGGLGKTTLANVVYEKLRTQFDCWAFVSVSQTPDMKKLFKAMLSELGKMINEEALDERRLINLLRDFLQDKRYFIIIDDIWNISTWEMIRCALPDNSAGYRVITTTRISTVAEHIGGAYNMKALCLENSRILLFRRIFGNEEKVKCPDELVEVSDRILNKCGGVPLAIITIASLLANKRRDKIEWYDVCNSIDSGLEKNSLDVENMRRILSLSYYDMPFNLRTCLLYLSVFPQDYSIGISRLIWMWIAEGFIRCEEEGVTPFEMGERYFNELTNRSMIQPIFDYGMIDSCRVHDMVLDLIRSLSSEEKFVTIWNYMDQTSISVKVRRLSLQNGKLDHTTPMYTNSMQQVRSVIFFESAVHLMPYLIQSFKVLRVLDLEAYDHMVGSNPNIKYIGNLFHLRYLRLIDDSIARLPDEVGNLQFLQTLVVRSSRLSSLPSTIVQLRHLMCLQIEEQTKVQYRIGSLTSLEELSHLGIHDDSKGIIEELGRLTELRVLSTICYINEWNSSLDKSLVDSLNKLQKIQSLFISVLYGVCRLDGWVVAPRHLCRLELVDCWFSTLPAWVNPLFLLDLSMLTICVGKLKQEDLEILGRLPALHYLMLVVDHENLRIHERFAIGACLFPCLVDCDLWGFGGPVVFQQGAMPRLTRLELGFPVQVMREINGSFYLGLGNLLSLQNVKVWFRSRGASEEQVEEAKAAVRHEIEIHPSHPNLQIHDA